MRWTCLAAIFVFCLAAPAAHADTKTIWELRDGEWMPVRVPTTGPTTKVAVNEPVLDRAEKLLAAKDPGAAEDVLLAWEKQNKKNPARDRCIFLLADVFFQEKDRVKSFYYLDELMDEYPESDYFTAALQKQFDIANAYLHGYRETFLWMPILDRADDGVQMMYRIQQRAPGSPLADRALLETADYYYGDQQYDVAQDAYAAYVRSYPRSSEVPRVRLRAAFSSLVQFRGVLFDATPLIDARAQLVDIQRTYPELAAEENVGMFIEQIDDAFAKKLLETGRFYQRTHQIKGAVFEYRFLTQTYPSTVEAKTARELLRKMPASALTDPFPPYANGYAPATTRPAIPSPDANH